MIYTMKVLTSDVHEFLQRSVLCWFATCSSDLLPNVSPKEVFCAYEDDIIIANIASPQSLRNIQENNKVCLSFIDIFVQKGFQLKGKAQIISMGDPGFIEMRAKLEEITKGKYPFVSITRISVNRVKRIVAPSYLLYPDSKESDQIASAYRSYGVNPSEKN